MAQLDEAAAVAEAEVTPTAPENSAVDTTEAQTDDLAGFYGEDPEQGDQTEEEQQDGDEEPEQQEAVQAPASLKPEEKEQFAQLPPEAQRFAADLLARRDRETQQGLEQARTAQRQAETSAADTVAHIKQDFAQRATQLVQAFAPQPPPPELARQDPGHYTYLKAVFDEENAQYQALVEQVTGLQGQAGQHFQGRQQEQVQERIKGLMSIPEFANEETRGQFINDIESFGTKDLGYSVEQLAQMDVTDMSALKKAMSWKADAMKWRDHQKRRNERPRQAQGRFASAPVGNAIAQNSGNDVLKSLYPND